ncbi:MAG: hypothetical protein L3J80_00080 [Thermoplasmata archaeon]|nr:hypothetical protein [Thermoplasmata archaeon]
MLTDERVVRGVKERDGGRVGGVELSREGGYRQNPVARARNRFDRGKEGRCEVVGNAGVVVRPRDPRGGQLVEDGGEVERSRRRQRVGGPIAVFGGEVEHAVGEGRSENPAEVSVGKRVVVRVCEIGGDGAGRVIPHGVVRVRRTQQSRLSDEVVEASAVQVGPFGRVRVREVRCSAPVQGEGRDAPIRPERDGERARGGIPEDPWPVAEIVLKRVVFLDEKVDVMDRRPGEEVPCRRDRALRQHGHSVDSEADRGADRQHDREADGPHRTGVAGRECPHQFLHLGR